MSENPVDKYGFNVFDPDGTLNRGDTDAGRDPSRPQVKWKKLRPDAQIPSKSRESDAGLDVYVVPDEKWDDGQSLNAEQNQDYIKRGDLSFTLRKNGGSHIFSTGISAAIIHPTVDWYYQFQDRSGMGAVKKVHYLAGVVEGTYRDEWKVALINLSDEDVVVRPGDRIVQALLTPIYNADHEEVDELPPSDRGKKGFGSSGE